MIFYRIDTKVHEVEHWMLYFYSLVETEKEKRSWAGNFGKRFSVGKTVNYSNCILVLWMTAERPAAS
jgi:hypothetical protein